MSDRRFTLAGVAAGLIALVTAPRLAGATTTKCTGGTIAAGSHGSLVVAGPCALPDSGLVSVSQSVTVTSKGALYGATLATLLVGGNVRVSRGGILILGCSPGEIGCAGKSENVIGQSLRADGALAVIVHGTRVGGNVAINGGGGGVTCDPMPGLLGPAYFDLEDSTVGQSVRITNTKSCWLGVFRNTVHGSVTVLNNTLADPDADEIATNVIAMSLNCAGNSPAAQLGDSGGTLNTVGGSKNGECAGL